MVARSAKERPQKQCSCRSGVLLGFSVRFSYFMAEPRRNVMLAWHCRPAAALLSLAHLSGGISPRWKESRNGHREEDTAHHRQAGTAEGRRRAGRRPGHGGTGWPARGAAAA